VKKAALVQYAINPHMFMGTVQSDDARTAVATANVKSFIEKMNGHPYMVVSLDEVKANPQYAAAKATLEGYYTAPGMRYFTDDKGAEKAELTAEQATKLCADLGVDAVAIIYDSWGMQSAAMGFQMKARPVIFVNMYDKSGTKVWGDAVAETSDESMASPGGIIATDVDTVVKSFNEAFVMSLAELGKHVDAAK
jgi:hypothetical protein